MAIYTVILEIMFTSIFVAFFAYNLVKKQYRTLGEFSSIFVLGLSAEILSILVNEDYHYSSHFLVQVIVPLKTPPVNVPLVIGFSWALIVYSSMRVINKIEVKTWTQPFLDALLALSLDLSIDIIAIRIEGGLWRWVMPLADEPTTESFFGVPYFNYYGWYFFVVSISFIIRYLRLVWPEKEEIWLTWALLAVGSVFPHILIALADLVIIILYKFIFQSFISEGIIWLLATVALLTGTIIVLAVEFARNRPQISKDVDPLSITVFITFHGLVMIFYFLLEMYTTAPLLILVPVLMFIVGITILWIVTDVEKVRMYLKSASDTMISTPRLK